MALSDLLSALENGQADTPDTPQPVMGYQAKPLPLLACTLDTPDTPQFVNAANDGAEQGAFFAWLIHFTDRNPLTVTFSPMVDHAGALACYPDAVAAEPIIAARSDEATNDDRHTCGECGNLQRSVCVVASPGGVVSASRGYRPGQMFREQPHRCEGFAEPAAASG